MDNVQIMQISEGDQDLCDKELGDPLAESALFGGQDHFQHVTLQVHSWFLFPVKSNLEFLHDHEYTVRCLQHLLEFDDSGMLDFLEDLYFRPQEVFLVRREFQLVN